MQRYILLTPARCVQCKGTISLHNTSEVCHPCAVQEHQAKGGKVTVPVGCVGLEDWLLDNVDIYKLLPRLRQGAGKASLLAAAAFAAWCCAALQSYTQAEGMVCSLPEPCGCHVCYGSTAGSSHCESLLRSCGALAASLLVAVLSFWSPIWTALCRQAASSHCRCPVQCTPSGRPSMGLAGYLPLIEAMPACTAGSNTEVNLLMVCSNNSTRTKPQKAYNPFDEDEPGNTPKADPSLTIDELMARKPAGASTAALDELGSPRNGPKPGAAEEDLNPNEPRLDLPQLATGQQSWPGRVCQGQGASWHVHKPDLLQQGLAGQDLAGGQAGAYLYQLGCGGGGAGVR